MIYYLCILCLGNYCRSSFTYVGFLGLMRLAELLCYTFWEDITKYLPAFMQVTESRLSVTLRRNQERKIRHTKIESSVLDD